MEQLQMLKKYKRGGATVLASLAVAHSLAYGYGQAPDVVCPKQPKTLPLCGAGDNERGPFEPPSASIVSLTTASSSLIIAGGTFVDTVTDQEGSVPPKPGTLWITLS
jgi:hypothetical protein